MIRCYTRSSSTFTSFREKMLSYIEEDKSNHDLSVPIPVEDPGLLATHRITDALIGNLSSPAERPYFELVKSYIRPALEDYASLYPKPTTMLISNLWWTEYSTHGSFDWHTHEGNNLVATIMLHIEDPLDITQIHNRDLPNADNGSILVFPASVPHRGRPTIGKKKIILGMNLNVACNQITDSYKNKWGKNSHDR